VKLIVGLGNPGEKYESTRHNVGFTLIDSYAETLGMESFQNQPKFDAEIAKKESLLLAKPQTFMNDSGRSVRKLADYYQVSSQDMWICHDDLDLTLGEYKIQFAKGPKIHNGVNSVEQTLGTINFWRVRIGVDNRTPEERQYLVGRDYVLKKLKQDEKIVLAETVGKIVAELAAKIQKTN